MKLLVSFNGEPQTITVDSSITFDELNSKIKNLVSNHLVSARLSYTYSFLDGVEQEKEAKVGCIGCDEDVRAMMRGFELLKSGGKSCRICVFACGEKNGEGRNWVLGEGGFCGDYGVLREDLGTQLSENGKDGSFVDESLKRFCESELKILENELDDVGGLNDGLEEGDEDLGSWNEYCDGRVIDFGVSDDDSSLSCGEKTSDFGNELNTHVVGDENFGKGLPVPLLGSGKQNSEEGTSCIDDNGRLVKFSSVSVNGSCGQGSLILDSDYGTRSESSEAMKGLESTISNGIDKEHSQSRRTSFADSDSSLALYTNEKEDTKRERTQSSHQSNFSINKKDQDEDVSASSKAYERMSAEVAACYSHLESIELQTIKYSDLEIVKKLGEGAYGIVYYGKCKGGDVAIKRVKLNCSTEGTPDEDKLVKDFWKEAHILGRLQHPNIVALFGVVTDGPTKYLAAVTEYMVNGSLKQVLRKRDRTIDRRKRVIIARDAASGMEYLHENNIVHFDLKSHNLLVNMRDPQRPVCKIGDLGLSKIKHRSLVLGGFRGTLPWMAPELFDAKSMVTEKIDVYSFGIVMWELLTGETPYANMQSKEIIAAMIERDLRPETPSWCDPVWRSLMERCWSSDPDTRPSFSNIVKEPRAIATSMNIR